MRTTMKQHNIFTNRAILYSLVLSAKIIKSKEFSDKDIRQYPDFQGKSFFMIFKHILIRTYFRKFRTLVSDLSRDFVLFFLLCQHSEFLPKIEFFIKLPPPSCFRQDCMRHVCSRNAK